MTEKDSKPVWRISAASKSKPRNRKRKLVPAAELPDGLSKDNDVDGESLLDVEMDHQDASVYAQTSEELSAMAHQLGCDERSHCDKVNEGFKTKNLGSVCRTAEEHTPYNLKGCEFESR